jgi:prenylcysteine oxidase/farnesylcysteine lyase
LCRYGFSPARARALAANEKFTLNDILGNGTLVSSVEEIAASMGILDHMAQTGEQRLHDESISEAYQADIVAPEVRRRFGQGLNGLNGHALAVAMYDGDQRMGLNGGRGFESHFETLALASGASLKLDTNVAGIYKNSSREWILEVQNTRTGSQPEYMMFNAVILAAPFNSSELDFLPEPPKQSPEMLDFGACHLTLFTSTHKLCSETFDSSTDLPDTIFAGEGVRQNPDLFDFFELALVRPVTHSVEEVLMTEYLYRVLSPGLVSPSDLIAIGRGNVTWSHHSKVCKPSLDLATLALAFFCSCGRRFFCVAHAN